MRARRPTSLILALALALALGACKSGPPECGPGFYPENGACVPFPDNGDAMPRPDAGTTDTGPAYPDASDAGFIEPLDASIYDSGHVEAPPEVTLGERGRILLTGSAVLPMAASNPIAPGEVYVDSGRIACVGALGACAAMSAGASVVATKGVILPGLIDSHNHLAYDWLPEWTPGRTWADHQQWQGSSQYDAFISAYRDNAGDHAKFCAMAQWGEMRALVNGTTTMYGAIAARRCISWLVRNAELSFTYNGFSDDRLRSNVLGIDTVSSTDATTLAAAMDAGDVKAYMIHLAEGKSTRAHAEYEELVRLQLLRAETVIIHGTALTAADFTAVAAAGTKLVWSPSSNMALYGDTTDVASAAMAGVPISIAPDWTPSGVDSILPELRFAKTLLETRAPALFTDRELLEMVTRVAAENMAIERDVGTLEPGKLADLLVLSVDDAQPYAAALQARSHDVRLVMIGGVPSYGDPAILGAMRETPSSCYDFAACNVLRRACWEDSAEGAVDPAAVEETIRSFYPDGPFGLFKCE